MPGRLPSSIKNRFYSSANKRNLKIPSILTKSSKFQAEDDILIDSLFDLPKQPPAISTPDSVSEKDSSQIQLIKTHNKLKQIDELYTKIANLEEILLNSKEILKNYESRHQKTKI